jgi:hypothetical protein
MAKQVRKVYLCNDEKIAEYVKEVRKIEKSFDGFEGSFSTERDLLHGVLLLVERQWPPQPIDATSQRRRFFTPAASPQFGDTASLDTDFFI